MSKENEENESEINEIEYLSASKKISEDDNFLDNKDYNIFNENNSEEDNDDDNDDNDDNIMQIDEERLNKKVIEGFRLLHLKLLYNFTEAAYNDIIKLFANKNISLYKVWDFPLNNEVVQQSYEDQLSLDLVEILNVSSEDGGESSLNISLEEVLTAGTAEEAAVEDDEIDRVPGS